jgi:hypothetical protein
MGMGIMAATVSLDGYIADESDGVGPLSEWYGNGDNEITGKTPIGSLSRVGDGCGPDGQRQSQPWTESKVDTKTPKGARFLSSTGRGIHGPLGDRQRRLQAAERNPNVTDQEDAPSGPLADS